MRKGLIKIRGKMKWYRIIVMSVINASSLRNAMKSTICTPNCNIFNGKLLSLHQNVYVEGHIKIILH